MSGGAISREFVSDEARKYRLEVAYCLVKTSIWSGLRLQPRTWKIK
jgi:hypothetical protein